jgi:protein-S-isoprenylcysteine O-methyltransferase Ste14
VGEGRKIRLIRHLVAIAVLPFTVAVVIPVWIARRYGIEAAIGTSWRELAIQAAGVAPLAIGLLLFVSSLRRFATDGRGTLAPWDPPVALVVRGPYRYVRNPMISGVVLMLVGESCLLLSRRHAAWALAFFVLNAIYIPLLEEPLLEARFGAPYRDYCKHVRRLIPRLRPWSAPPNHLVQ